MWISTNLDLTLGRTVDRVAFHAFEERSSFAHLAKLRLGLLHLHSFLDVHLVKVFVYVLGIQLKFL